MTNNLNTNHSITPVQQNHQPTESQFTPNRAQINAQVSQNLRDVKITRFVVANQIVIQGAIPANEPSANDTAGSPVIIKPGQQVYLLTSHKGTFLRTPDKKYITFTEEIRNKLFNSIVKNETPSTNGQPHGDCQAINPLFYQPIDQQANNNPNMSLQKPKPLLNNEYQEGEPIYGTENNLLNLNNNTVPYNMTNGTNIAYSANQSNGNDLVMNYNECSDMTSKN